MYKFHVKCPLKRKKKQHETEIFIPLTTVWKCVKFRNFAKNQPAASPSHIQKEKKTAREKSQRITLKPASDLHISTTPVSCKLATSRTRQPTPGIFPRAACSQLRIRIRGAIPPTTGASVAGKVDRWGTQRAGLYFRKTSGPSADGSEVIRLFGAVTAHAVRFHAAGCRIRVRAL